jgi:putative acetyltransferase
VVIELWRPEHAQGAIEVVRSVFDEYGFTWDEEGYHADLYDVPRHYFQTDCPFYVALQENRVVGTAALDCFDELNDAEGTTCSIEGMTRIVGCDCALERLYVLPTARRGGIGSQLLDAIIVEARRRDRRRLEIWSDKRFTDAHRLYQRFGAKVVADRMCDDPDVSPEWGLALDL